jgi:hypothetical protein
VVMPTGKHHYDASKNLIETRNLKWTIFWCINRSLTTYMVYIDMYIPIYMFKYVYVHIRVRQQLE